MFEIEKFDDADSIYGKLLDGHPRFNLGEGETKLFSIGHQNKLLIEFTISKTQDGQYQCQCDKNSWNFMTPYSDQLLEKIAKKINKLHNPSSFYKKDLTVNVMKIKKSETKAQVRGKETSAGVIKRLRNDQDSGLNRALSRDGLGRQPMKSALKPPVTLPGYELSKKSSKTVDSAVSSRSGSPNPPNQNSTFKKT